MATWTQTAKTVPAGPDARGKKHVPAPFRLHRPISNLRFERKALFAAIARCNLSKGVPRRIAQAEARATAEWLSSLVDEQARDFGLLPAVSFYKDFVRTGKIGQLAAGMGYLYMIRRGYPFLMHWEDAPAHPAPRQAAKSLTSPDFIFVGDSNEWVLMESKGTLSGSVADIKRVSHHGYTHQVDPYVGRGTSAARISHGFVIGVHATPPSPTSLCVVRTPQPQAARRRRGEAPRLTATATVRACYRSAFALMGVDQAVTAIDTAESSTISGLRELTFGGRTVLVHPATLNDALRAGLSADTEEFESPFAGLFGIEKEIGNTVLAAMQQPADATVATPIAALNDDVMGSLGGDVAVFPDGLVWIPLRELERENGGGATIPRAPVPPSQLIGHTLSAFSTEIEEPLRTILQLQGTSLPLRAIVAALGVKASENGWNEEQLRAALRLRLQPQAQAQAQLRSNVLDAVAPEFPQNAQAQLRYRTSN